MKTHFSILKTFVLSALVLSSVACKYDLVTEPTRDKNAALSAADYGDSIQPPANVTASQGDYRSVTLNWDAVKNAIQYQIYSADTPYDTFVQVGETEGKETTFTLENELTGTTQYYLIKAVNYYGTVSKGSKIISATTLDTPIITEIEASSEGTSMTVSWWMGNCTADTYAKEIMYIITAYDSTKTKVPGVEKTVEGYAENQLQNSTVIEGLSASTSYYFVVEAVKKNSNQKSEKSDYTNAETAHRIIPDAVGSFTAAQGISTDDIVLSWQLPAPVEYRDRKTMVYSVQPVYFTISRKLKDAEDSTYTVLESYIGAYGDSGIIFNCAENSSNNSKLTVTKDETGVTPIVYSKYTSLSTLTYTDKSALRGKQYTYLIQSYTDAAPEANTSDESSVAAANGWQTPSVSFAANNELSVEETTITNINVSFEVDFTAYEVPYTYVITQQRTAFGDDAVPDAETVIYSSNNLTELNSSRSSKDFTNTSDAGIQGKYIYRFYLINGISTETTSVPSEFIESIKADNEITVTDDANAIPKITNFTVQDGYKNKYVLTWDEIPSTAENPVIYTVKWSTPAESITRGEGETELTDSDYSVSDGKITYKAPAESGDSRIFTLKAVKNGIPDTAVYDSVSKTLGTAVPVMAKPDYKSITVSWPSVQKADTAYEITAKYSDNSSAIAEEPVITEENGTVTCVLNNPAGYDDITKSGLPVTFTVKATNTTTGDFTEAPVTVRTMGPALIGTAVENTIYDNRLQMTWNKVDAATGYIIYRTKYFYDDSWTNWEFERADTYFYDASTDTTKSYGKVTNNGSEVSESRVKIALKDNKYTLTDYDCDQTDTTSAYEMNQSQISWGIPFGYVVIPVNGDKDDFTFGDDSEYLNVTGGKAGVVYSNAFADQKAATYGYGLNVRAGKAESAEEITVEWNVPSNTNLSPTVYRMRYSKEDNHDYGSNWEKVAENLPKGTILYKDKLNTTDLGFAFVYAVQYQAPSISNLKLSYRNDLQNINKNADDRYSFPDKPEVKNKGYLLALNNFKASYGGTGTSKGHASYYQENVTWDKDWDYEERALGPDSFSIAIKNRNVSSTMAWTTISNTEINNKTQTTTTVTGFADTTVTKNVTEDGISLIPVGLTNGTAVVTNDLLKVLRDAKHYYSVLLTREGLSEPVRQAADNTVYTYRQISEEELCRCVGLIIADSVYKCGVPNRKTYNTSGHTGEFKLACSTGTTDANRVQWQCSDYTNKYTKACSSDDMGSLNSFLTLNSATSSFESKGIYGETLYYLPDLEIEVKCDGEIKLSTYSGTVKFTAGGCSWSIFSVPSDLKHNLTMYLNSSKVISISNNKDSMYKYFPYDLGNKHEDPDSTVNTSLQTYQGDWWN